MNTISCIIPAYNEAPRIGGVLAVAAKHPLISEVIVIDDGSTDDTRRVAAEFPVKLIAQKNCGKTAAVVAGLKAATGEFVIFLDADLIGLSARDVTALIQPVISGAADISMSVRGNMPLWVKVGIDFLSGERVVRRSFLAPHLAALQGLHRFGLEAFMNEHIISARLKVAVVQWDDVASPFKYHKFGFWKGLFADIAMTRQIFSTISLPRAFHQIRELLALKVPPVVPDASASS